MKKTKKDEVLELFQERPFLRLKEIMACGIVATTVEALVRDGVLVKLSRGIYGLSSYNWNPRSCLAVIVSKVENGVVCLESALAFHKMIPEYPPSVWVAIPSGQNLPRIKQPPVEVVNMSPVSIEYGLEYRQVRKIEVPVTGPAKTVADCFKFRKRIGLEVALRALDAYFAMGKGSPEELLEAAEVSRVGEVIPEYIFDAITKSNETRAARREGRAK